MSEVRDTVGLRDPLHQVSPRAVAYWRVKALIGTLVECSLALAFYRKALPVILDHAPRPWWALPLLILVLLVPLVHLLVMPPLRYRIHRWEVTPTAIHTRSGWLSIENRVAPLSRVQTVDSNQGPLMRSFGLSSLTVTTASAAGPITIVCLDQDDARQLVRELTVITAATDGDAT